MKKYFASSELIINEDGSVFHLHVKPEWLADKVILVGDPGRVALVASHFENKECEVESREFKTITGTYRGKRITVVSTGIGCDNIDIVMNELDALANIDFETREEKPCLRSLELVRIGTCGGLQPYTPVGTFVCSEKSIGFDGLLNFYAGRNSVCDLPMERAFLNHMGWSGNMCAPATRLFSNLSSSLVALPALSISSGNIPYFSSTFICLSDGGDISQPNVGTYPDKSSACMLISNCRGSTNLRLRFFISARRFASASSLCATTSSLAFSSASSMSTG